MTRLMVARVYNAAKVLVSPLVSPGGGLHMTSGTSVSHHLQGSPGDSLHPPPPASARRPAVRAPVGGAGQGPRWGRRERVAGVPGGCPVAGRAQPGDFPRAYRAVDDDPGAGPEAPGVD